MIDKAASEMLLFLPCLRPQTWRCICCCNVVCDCDCAGDARNRPLLLAYSCPPCANHEAVVEASRKFLKKRDRAAAKREIDDPEGSDIPPLQYSSKQHENVAQYSQRSEL